MTSHQLDVLMKRIEALELCVSASLADKGKGRERSWDELLWLEKDAEVDGHHLNNKDHLKIMNPRDMVNTRANDYEFCYKQMVEARNERLKSRRLEQEQQAKAKEERLRVEREQQEEAMYQRELMKERVAARVRAQAKILEEEARQELLRGTALFEEKAAEVASSVEQWFIGE